MGVYVDDGEWHPLQQWAACKISADMVAKASESVLSGWCSALLNITVSQVSVVGISPWEDVKNEKDMLYYSEGYSDAGC